MKRDIINATSTEEKSTICCVNNQPCLFNHSVMMHTVVENILSHFSPVDSTKEKCTMYLSEAEYQPQTTILLKPTKKRDFSNYSLNCVHKLTKCRERIFKVATAYLYRIWFLLSFIKFIPAFPADVYFRSDGSTKERLYLESSALQQSFQLSRN